MERDYSEARRDILRLNSKFPAGTSIVGSADEDPPLMVVGHALNSDHLASETIVFDKITRGMWRIPSEKLRLSDGVGSDVSYLLSTETIQTYRKALAAGAMPFDRTKELSNTTLPGSVAQHYKGGVYTILTVLGLQGPDPIIVYLSHADGTWWTRSWKEFGDGRFEGSTEKPLDVGEANLEDLLTASLLA